MQRSGVRSPRRPPTSPRLMPSPASSGGNARPPTPAKSRQSSPIPQSPADLGSLGACGSLAGSSIAVPDCPAPVMNWVTNWRLTRCAAERSGYRKVMTTADHLADGESCTVCTRMCSLRILRVTSPRRFPAAELALQTRRDRQRDIFSPRCRDNLHPDGQAASRNPAPHHRGRPSGHVVCHGVAEAVEVLLLRGGAVKQRG